jgi:26S proteasome regulatory subunit N7
MEDVLVDPLPNLQLPQWEFLLKQSTEITRNKDEIRNQLMEAIKKDNMLPYYQHLCDELKWPKETALMDQMKRVNDDKLSQLDAAIKDAVENLGESEVREANLAKANFFTRIGDKDNAVNQFRVTEEKTIGSGQKLDIVFTQIRLGIFWMDHDLISRMLDKAKAMVEAGSDWDRRNRLKVYEALYKMSTRNFEHAAKLFLETIPSFTAVELLDYNVYIFYTILMCTVSLDRVTLKQKVLHAPEILQVIDKMPHVGKLMNSLYNCDYSSFFSALAEVTDEMKRNRLLAPHAGFYCKEMRVLAYAQMLESYKSVQLGTMAHAFGVTAEFLDNEISRFIASGRLHCKIDKVAGIIETNRPDSKNAQYQATIKQGDALLNRVQKLSRIINL